MHLKYVLWINELCFNVGTSRNQKLFDVVQSLGEIARN